MTEEVQGIVTRDSIGIPYESGIDLAAMLANLAKYTAATFVVLLVFWAFAHLLRRMLDKTNGQRGHSRIRLVESTRLFGDKMLHIVRVDDKDVLIGTSRDGISYLGELSARALEQSPEGEPHSDSAGERYRVGLQALGESTVSCSKKALSTLKELVVSWVNRAREVAARRSSGARRRQLAVDESEILREEALKIGMGNRAFSELLDEEVSASDEATNRDDQGERLARLRSLAARSARRNGDE